MKRSIPIKLLGSALLVAQMGWVACNSSDYDTTTTTEGHQEHATKTSETTESSMQAMATLSGTMPDTALNGTVKFDQHEGKVKMTLEITVPSKANQSVAVHLHEHGDCGDMGKGAMGHWNPTNQSHGKWGSASFHSGDIGNVSLDASGKGTMELETDQWTVGGDSTTNIIHRAVIVHSGVDDYTTQPTGNAGGRIGCGVINSASH